MKFPVTQCVECGTEMEGPGSRGGRPSRFCSEGCKTSAGAEMRRLNVLLRKFEEGLRLHEYHCAATRAA
jgi:hypothetical protein